MTCEIQNSQLACLILRHHKSNGRAPAGFFTWEKVRLGKGAGARATAVEFDLTIYDLLFPPLEQVPIEERVGANTKGEHGLPIRCRTFAKSFHKITRYAKIPDEVWNMDARAGGATEAEEAASTLA